MPRAAKPDRIVSAEAPPRRGRGLDLRSEALADLAAFGLPSAPAEMPGRKPQALALGLRKAAEASGAGVKIVSRAGRVNLQCG